MISFCLRSSMISHCVAAHRTRPPRTGTAAPRVPHPTSSTSRTYGGYIELRSHPRSAQQASSRIPSHASCRHHSSCHDPRRRPAGATQSQITVRLRGRECQLWALLIRLFFEYVTKVSEPFLKFATHKHKESASSSDTLSARAPNPVFRCRTDWRR